MARTSRPPDRQYYNTLLRPLPLLAFPLYPNGPTLYSLQRQYLSCPFTRQFSFRGEGLLEGEAREVTSLFLAFILWRMKTGSPAASCEGQGGGGPNGIDRTSEMLQTIFTIKATVWKRKGSATVRDNSAPSVNGYSGRI